MLTVLASIYGKILHSVITCNSILLISLQHRTNRTLFKHVPTRHMKEEEIVDITSPTVSGEGGTGVIEASFETDPETEEDSTGVYTTADQLSEKLLTMSLVPRARWQTLLNLDVIRVYYFPALTPT